MKLYGLFLPLKWFSHCSKLKKTVFWRVYIPKNRKKLRCYCKYPNSWLHFNSNNRFSGIILQQFRIFFPLVFFVNAHLWHWLHWNIALFLVCIVCIFIVCSVQNSEFFFSTRYLPQGYFRKAEAEFRAEHYREAMESFRVSIQALLSLLYVLHSAIGDTLSLACHVPRFRFHINTLCIAQVNLVIKKKRSWMERTFWSVFWPKTNIYERECGM